MNKQIVAVLAGIFCFGTVGASADEISFLRAVSKAREAGVSVPKNVFKAVPRSSGIYLPAGTSWKTLQEKIARMAEEAKLNLPPADVKTVAYTPELWQSFQAEVGRPLFEGRPLSREKSMSVLQKNREKFTLLREQGDYETAWREFVVQRRGVPYEDGQTYEKASQLGEDVYEFYVQHIGLENMPRVRAVGAPGTEGVVLEIPVNMSVKVPFSMHTFLTVSPEKHIVFRQDDGVFFLLERQVLEQKELKSRFAIIQ